MQDAQTHYFFDVQAGEEITTDDYGVALPSIDDAACDAVVIAADIMGKAPEVGRPVTVTVRTDRAALLRVCALLTMERVES